MRALEPEHAGTVEVDGVAIGYETFGAGDRAVVLMPTWCIVHSRIWKLIIPYLARRFRVLAWDGPGNGKSDRPPNPAAYSADAHVRCTLAVMDAACIESAGFAAASGGTHRTLRLASQHPERVDSIAFIGPLSHLTEDLPPPEVLAALERGDLQPFAEAFMTAAFNEPHSTKAIEDGIGWAKETTMDVLQTALFADVPEDRDDYARMCSGIEQPVLVIQGSEDLITPPANGKAVAESIGANAHLVTIEGGGHRGDVRDPARVGILLRDFFGAKPPMPAASGWTRGTARTRRALYLSSPIGLGHARRDVAIARELRRLHPEVEIEWLAQDPVTRVLESHGETIHPASRLLANESAHMTAESAGHELRCFQAWRRMDEILAANFMVLQDLLEARDYDLLIGDEAWEADHYLHENPELKRCPFVWLTDFVGWLPTDDGPANEAALVTDYNAEMIEHVERFPWVRDAALFVGAPADIVPLDFGPGLPAIRSWTEANFEFTGYIAADGAPAPADAAATRAALGVAGEERICIAAVGGSGVGGALLGKLIDAFPQVRKEIPDLRLVAIAGPRIHPDSLGDTPDGVSVLGYVPDLPRHLAACDLAIVQGGLTTAMELVAANRPFLYFPLAAHFEQETHVAHRLARHRAGRRMDFSATGSDELTAAITTEISRELDYRPVPTDGAERAAKQISSLL